MSLIGADVLHIVRPQSQEVGVEDGRQEFVAVISADQKELKEADIEYEPCGEEFGKRGFKKMQDPKLPSHEEIAEHDLSHLPYRSWCRHYVKGRWRESPHEQSKEKPLMNKMHFDCAFLGKEGQPGKLLSVLVVK